MNPESLGWCKGCGYCRSLEEERTRVPLPQPTGPARSSPFGVVEFLGLLGYLPQWLWVMLAGVAGVVAFSLPPRLSLPEEGLPRCLWSTIQIGLGILMILAAQVWALLVLADGDECLSYKDAVLSGRLWGLTLRKLPATQRQLWLGTWGIATILSAILLVGGLSHWLTYLPRASTAAPVAAEQEAK